MVKSEGAKSRHSTAAISSMMLSNVASECKESTLYKAREAEVRVELIDCRAASTFACSGD